MNSLARQLHCRGRALMLCVTLLIGTTATAAEPSTQRLKQGWVVFNRTCTVCHWPGVGGAPRIADKAAWKARIEGGKERLYRHAIRGWRGGTGKKMPARGGNWNLTDEEVKAAGDYIVHNSQ